MHHAIYIDQEFIQPARVDHESAENLHGVDEGQYRAKEILISIVQFLIDASGVDVSAKKVADEAREEIRQVEKGMKLAAGEL